MTKPEHRECVPSSPSVVGKPLKGKVNLYGYGKLAHKAVPVKDIRSAVEWAEHEMLHTNKDKIDVLYEAFEDVLK